eukprot:1159132-Pelagomonas_calceolata.AAC.3
MMALRSSDAATVGDGRADGGVHGARLKEVMMASRSSGAFNVGDGRAPGGMVAVRPSGAVTVGDGRADGGVHNCDRCFTEADAGLLNGSRASSFTSMLAHLMTGTDILMAASIIRLSESTTIPSFNTHLRTLCTLCTTLCTSTMMQWLGDADVLMEDIKRLNVKMQSRSICSLKLATCLQLHRTSFAHFRANAVAAGHGCFDGGSLEGTDVLMEVFTAVEQCYKDAAQSLEGTDTLVEVFTAVEQHFKGTTQMNHEQRHVFPCQCSH